MEGMTLPVWNRRRRLLQEELWRILGRPADTVEPSGEVRDRTEWDGVVVEKLVYETEPGQAVPALLYLPTACAPPFPALVICMGHGESKTTPGPLHAGPLFARLGIACLCADPIGEEERNRAGHRGTRAHDAAAVSSRSRGAGRKVIGKMVWDLMMGPGYLATRRDIDAQHLGCAGVSLGGTAAGYLLALDERLKMALPAGWFFRPEDRVIGKDCSRLPAQELQQVMSNGELLGLAAPHCAVLVANGDADTVIDKQGSGMVAVRGMGPSLQQAQEIYGRYPGAAGRIAALLEPGGGHRHYYLAKPALLWARMHLQAAGISEAALLELPEMLFGDWADRCGVVVETLYDTPLHFRGLRLPDLQLRPLPAEHRRCLYPGEVGTARFTLEGWLDCVTEGAAC